MEAILLDSFGISNDFKKKHVPTPEPKEQEVQILIENIGINLADKKAKLGLFGGNLPLILGLDCSGEVTKVGRNVKKFKIGDKVLALCMGFCTNGTYAEYVCVREELVCKVPSNITMEQAASLPVITLTAYRAIIENKLFANDLDKNVLLTGASGGVGFIALQLLQLLKIKKIFAITGRSASKNFLANSLKLSKNQIFAREKLSYKELKDNILKDIGHERFYATFDFVGGDIKRICMELTETLGHFTTIVSEEDGKSTEYIDHMLCMVNSLNLHFIFCGAEAFMQQDSKLFRYEKQFTEIYKLISSGQLLLPPVQVLNGLTVENVIEAHELMEKRPQNEKIIIKCKS